MKHVALVLTLVLLTPTLHAQTEAGGQVEIPLEVYNRARRRRASPWGPPG